MFSALNTRISVIFFFSNKTKLTSNSKDCDKGPAANTESPPLLFSLSYENFVPAASKTPELFDDQPPLKI